MSAVLPQPSDQIATASAVDVLEPPAFDRDAYKQRNTVERCVNRLKLKQWRGLATRYDKTATIFLASLHIAGLYMWSSR